MLHNIFSVLSCIAVGGSVGGAIGGIIFLVFCIAGCIVFANGCKGGSRRNAHPPPRSLNLVTPSTNSDSPRYHSAVATPHWSTTATTASPYSTKPQEPPAPFPEKSELQTAPPPSYYDAQKYPSFTPGDPIYTDIPSDPIYTNIAGPYPAAADLPPQPPCSDYLNPATSCDPAHEDSAL